MRQFKRGQLTLLDGNTFAFVANTRQTSQLPVPSTYLKKLWLSLRGTLTVSAVTVPGTIHADGPANLVSNIELLIDGYPLKTGKLPHFLRMSQLYFKTDGVNDGLVSAGAGAYDFQALVPLCFEMPASAGRFDTVEDGRTIKNMVLNLTWGATSDLVVGNTSTLALTNTTVQVYVEDTEPNFERDPKTIYRFRETDTVFNNIVTSGGSRLLIPYTEGSIMRAVSLKSVDGSDLSDAIINTIIGVRINGGQEVPFNTIEDDFFQAYAKYLFGQDQMFEGYYHIEFAEDELVLTTGLGAGVSRGQLNTLEVIADTTVGAGATSITAHIAELVKR
jgi:hypothetical protein